MRRSHGGSKWIQQGRRDELVATANLSFSDGQPATLTSSRAAFALVVNATGTIKHQYTWEMVDTLVQLGIPFPAQLSARKTRPARGAEASVQDRSIANIDSNARVEAAESQSKLDARAVREGNESEQGGQG